ncbi:MAG: SDR family NAD(P)-dependent oxidoreductase [Mariprofundus sp.]|nr:SDR family NAD(P)-dependent oxidoreductase [Mariprofundus sp.]
MKVEYKHILVTGGVGSVGRAMIDRLLTEHPEVEKITIFSRDEHKQIDMGQELGEYSDRLRFIIGDIRNDRRIEEACRGVDAIIHAAAMRLVPAAEANPFEAVETNVVGTRNLIRAAKINRVQRVVAISSDKAVNPTTAYGATKFLMERLLIEADGEGDTRFCMVRYANILTSRSSVVPLFVRLRASGVLPITDPTMTRFSITMREGTDLIMNALTKGWGGEIICPISPSYKVEDMAMAIAPDAEHRIIGARPGEKKHEAMYSLVEASMALRHGSYIVLCPTGGRWTPNDYMAANEGVMPVDPLRDYNSGDNDDCLGVEQIRTLVEREL